MYVSKVDYAAMLRADMAKRLSLPYAASEEMAPARTPGGTVVGYYALGTGFISLDLASRADFELCRLQDERSSSFALDKSGKQVPISAC